MNVQKERKRRYYSRISIKIDKGVFDMKRRYKGVHGKYFFLLFLFLEREMIIFDKAIFSKIK